ncbi:MAG: molybdenum cofactor cytidylyltransferase [Rhodobacteraceae bacterium HLUCCO07]|nr:MAG: molybdenum cofactor cytidylyltransferase [Rhodobacteraceae bacterium HLUCCO07]
MSLARRLERLAHMDPIAILILAAGASSRMRGRDKLCEDAAGQPLLSRVVTRAMATRIPVLVTLPGPEHPRTGLIGGAGAVFVPDAQEGMGASIRAGVAALPPGTRAVMILPADMPDITTADLETMRDAFRAAPDQVHRATSEDGTPGHPVVFPARLFPALLTLRGDAGARAVLRGEAIRLVPLPDRHALTDLDTPEDFAAWRNV